MILDMIQGYRYLRRSTDQWPLSKNSTTRLKGLESWHRAALSWNCSIPITNTKGLYLYPGSNTTPSRPRLQHLLSKINTMASCPFRTRHQFISLFIFNPCHHAFLNAFLFHLWKSPSTERRRTLYRRRLYQFGPDVSLFPVPIFGVNICLFNYGMKGDLFRNWP
jgi:hypothetical protein